MSNRPADATEVLTRMAGELKGGGGGSGGGGGWLHFMGGDIAKILGDPCLRGVHSFRGADNLQFRKLGVCSNRLHRGACVPQLWATPQPRAAAGVLGRRVRPRVLFQSHTAGNPDTVLVMQGDGNLVLYAPGNRAIWTSNTAGNPDSRLLLMAEGNLALYTPGNQAIWRSTR